MNKELELLMKLMQQVRDENDYFTPKQLFNAMKNAGLEIRETPPLFKKAAEKVVDTMKSLTI